jgi:diguanylate cyclase (GGDEF)-like protein
MTLKNYTILYVEDNKDAQEQLKMILEDDVKEFYQAYNGKEGLALYKEKNPDIILTDINMPILDGLKMAKEIKDIDSQQPILIISSFDEKNNLLNAIEIMVDAFITKPIDMDILERKLKQVSKTLEHKREMQTKIDTLHNLAHYDTLTNIPNRFLFDIKLDQAISKATRHNNNVALFFIDLDNFKNINDAYGHKMGDKILIHVANNIKKVIRQEDTLARIGGDEFSLIIEDVSDKNYIDILAKKILNSVSTPLKYDNKTIDISCSIGISIFPLNCSSKDELIDLADHAMYKAKRGGKKDFSYHS